ncbi:MAG TPA: PH domain-containing protein [Streptosporangiaceae bacterium]|nr:PH domain-containing protein [Streptosporangiaceae bacterium]
MANAAGLTEGEHLVLRLHQHWKTVLRPFLILAATVIALLALLLLVSAVRDSAPARIALAVVTLVVVLTWVALPLLRWRTTSYELTNRRLRLRTGIVSRTGRDFPLSKISDVSFQQGLLDRLLGCGRLIVESPGERGQLVLTEIPHVQDVQATLFQLVENEQDRLAREQLSWEQQPPLPG